MRPSSRRVLAALRRGAYAVPINWHFKEEEVAYILKDSGARVLVVHSDLWRRVRDAAAPGLSALIVPTPPALCAAYGIADDEARLPTGQVSWDDWVEAQAPSEVPAPPPCESMIYTSGTTGVPKGVRRAARRRELRGTPGLARPRLRLPAGHARGHPPGRSITARPTPMRSTAARMGGLVVLHAAFRSPRSCCTVERHRITHVHMVPTMFVRLLSCPSACAGTTTSPRSSRDRMRAAPCPPR